MTWLPSPTAQVVAPPDQMPNRPKFTSGETCDTVQVAPSKCATLPRALNPSATHTSVGETAQRSPRNPSCALTVRRASVVQAVPFQCQSPAFPMAQTSDEPLPETWLNVPVAPVATGVQAAPPK